MESIDRSDSTDSPIKEDANDEKEEEEEEEENSHSQGATSAPIPIHPLLVQHAQQRQRGSSIGSSSVGSAGGGSRDSLFRHSFVEIDHPLASGRPSFMQPNGTIHEDAEGGESSATSLSDIIKHALAANAEPTNQQRAEATPTKATQPQTTHATPNQPSNMHTPITTPTHDIPSPSVGVKLPTTVITMTRLVKLLNHFVFYYSKNPGTYRASAKSMLIQHRVTMLAKEDYHVSVIANNSNRNGASNGPHSSDDPAFEYCSSYPLELIIFENEKTGPHAAGNKEDGTLQTRVNDSAVLKPLFRLSRFSRVHGRFVIPVILVNNKNICRSSTLAIQAEAIFNNIHSATKQMMSNAFNYFSGFGGGSSNANGDSSSVQVGLEGQRDHDIQLLVHTSTSYIEDLMVEHRKKKLGVALTSSEKNEQWRYSKMKLNGQRNRKHHTHTPV